MKELLTPADLEELIALIGAQYGYDLSGYAESSLRRRFDRFMQMAGITLFDLKYRLINDGAFFSSVLDALTVNVTEMFRDPDFYQALTSIVFPVLAALPTIKIWHAGCATGEEAFSMAILLHEAGLLSRSVIYATDVNRANLERARAGIIALKKMQQYTLNYQQAGGKADFSNYYTASYDAAIIDRSVRENIYFAEHNLVTDEVFNEFHLICCRNVLIYFKKSLKTRAIGLFSQSLARDGYLALGNREALTGSVFQRQFEAVSPQQRIFQLKTEHLLSSTNIYN